MELTPINVQTNGSAKRIDRRLQDIDRQINTALRDIRRNLEELEQASTRPAGSGDAGPAAGSGQGKNFARTLQDAIDRNPHTG